METLSNNNKDLRSEIRVKTKAVIPFNILENPDRYLRTYNPASSIFKQPEYSLELNENDPFEAFLIQLDVKLNYVIDLLSAKVQRKEYAYQGLLIDISATGMSFLYSNELEQGAILEVGLVLPAQPYGLMDIAGEVLRCQARTGGGKGDYKYEIGLATTDVRPDDQENIIHYIFQKQREEIRHQKKVS